jgi:16S rRNA (guanine966-N2)-methyltransferase
VVTDRAERLLSRPPGLADRYDLVFADPPYAVTADTVTRVLTLLADGWLADGALVVVERATRSGALEWPPGYQPGKSRRYGEATFWYGWQGGDGA